MARIHHAPTIQRAADLAEDFGLNLAKRWFGEEAIASLPVRQSGKNKGKPKGYLCWLSTTAPGYHPSIGRGCRENTTVRAWIGPGPYASESAALPGMWMGRPQNLCGSPAVLTAEYRERTAAQAAAARAEAEATFPWRDTRLTLRNDCCEELTTTAGDMVDNHADSDALRRAIIDVAMRRTDRVAIGPANAPEAVVSLASKAAPA